MTGMPGIVATLPEPAACWPLAGRVAALEAMFARIASTRMADIPILHAGLRVQARGFEAEEGGRAGVGVLVTPWFMNLVRLPLVADEPIAALGVSQTRRVGCERFEFIGALEDGFGAYEACSLFSPMFDFVDHDAAIATADAVMVELRRPPPAPPAPDAVVASRRALLFGRGAGARG
jgi:[NiFe] hydrogenase assembly HybE family chaperone